MRFKGKISIMTEIPKAIQFGTIAFFGIPSVKKFDQVKLPKLYTIGPKKMICAIAVLIKSCPGTGRLILLKRAHFCAQNIMK